MHNTCCVDKLMIKVENSIHILFCKVIIIKHTPDEAYSIPYSVILLKLNQYAPRDEYGSTPDHVLI